MSALGLLEGSRLKYRLGNPFIRPEDYQGEKHDREKLTTDWPALYASDKTAASARYASANSGSLDPEFNPTVESFMTSHNQPFQKDPAPLNPAPVAVYVNNPPPATDADYLRNAVDASAQAARTAAYVAAVAAKPVPHESDAATTPRNRQAVITDPAPKTFAIPLIAAVLAVLFVKG